MQNARVAAFTVSELFRENQQGVKLRPRRLGLNIILRLAKLKTIILFSSVHIYNTVDIVFNPLMPSGNKKVTHT